VDHVRRGVGLAARRQSYEDDRRDLARHEAEIAADETFNYALLDEAESELLGCVYIDPPGPGSPSGTDSLAVKLAAR